MGAIYRLTENEDRAIIWQADRQTDKISLSFFLHTILIVRHCFRGRAVSTVIPWTQRVLFARLSPVFSPHCG